MREHIAMPFVEVEESETGCGVRLNGLLLAFYSFEGWPNEQEALNAAHLKRNKIIAALNDYRYRPQETTP